MRKMRFVWESKSLKSALLGAVLGSALTLMSGKLFLKPEPYDYKKLVSAYTFLLSLKSVSPDIYEVMTTLLSNPTAYENLENFYALTGTQPFKKPETPKEIKEKKS